MTTFAFIELPAPLDTWVTVPGAILPVRAELADDLQRADAPDPEQLLFDLERYLDEHPDKTARFAEAGAQLAFRTAVELFTNRLPEEALQFYELSLRLRPNDVLTRYNYAVALHALCYRDAALAEYKRLMKSTTPQEHLRIWVLASQIHLHRHNYEEVVRLLKPLAETLYPTDDEFWEALGTARAAIGDVPAMPEDDATPASPPRSPITVAKEPKAPATPPRPVAARPVSAPPARKPITASPPPLPSTPPPLPKAPPPLPSSQQSTPPTPPPLPPVTPRVVAAAMCGACGAALKATSKFCPGCGAPVLAAAPSSPAIAREAATTCQHCGSPRRPGAKFCGSCGKA
jgi:hypothetical protein